MITGDVLVVSCVKKAVVGPTYPMVQGIAVEVKYEEDEFTFRQGPLQQTIKLWPKKVLVRCESYTKEAAMADDPLSDCRADS
jgi:hypothetical protein